MCSDVGCSGLCSCSVDVCCLLWSLYLCVCTFLPLLSPPLPHICDTCQNEADGALVAAVKEIKEMSLLDGKRAQVCV